MVESLGKPPARRRGAAGFTLVELIVAVAISLVVLTCMIPLFVNVEAKAAGDQMRVEALAVAQDRLEKIRALPFDQITLANLNSSTFMNGEFGNSWSAFSGTAQRVFSNGVSYAITVQNGGSGSTQLVVSVSVTWIPPPGPVKTVFVQTYISQQFAGPALTALTLSPENSAYSINSAPVTLSATVAAGTDRSNTDHVTFTVSGNGMSPFTQTVSNTGVSGAGLNGIYSCSWSASGAVNGTYTFAATAYTSAGVPGNSWSESAQLTLNSAPPQVTGLTATAGNRCATLSWTASTSSNFDHYQLWRGTTSGGETLDTDNLTANGITDTGLTNGTKYYYQVYALDANGDASPASAEVTVTPAVQSDTTAPTAPTNFTVTRSAACAQLSWSASSAASGIACYYIYRDGGAQPCARVGGSSTSFSDIVGYTVGHSYYVVACSGAGLLSAPSATASIQTATPPTYTLTVTVNKASPATSVDVTQTDALPTPIDCGMQSVTSAASGVWKSIPYGYYQVTAAYNGTTLTQTIYLNATQTVTFTF